MDERVLPCLFWGFFCGFICNLRTINSYGDVEGRVNTIELLYNMEGSWK